jgi:hypothetical protein
MKKLLFTVILSLAVVTASFYAQVKYLIHPEKRVTKNIQLRIASNNKYNAQLYSGCEATLACTIVKMNGKLADTVMQKQYPAISLKNLSSFAKTFRDEVSIPNIVQRKEKVIINYTIQYKSKESVMKVQYAKPVDNNSTKEQLSIIM